MFECKGASLQKGVEIVGGVGAVCQASWTHYGVWQARLHQQLLTFALVFQHACRQPLHRLEGHHSQINAQLL